MINRDAGDGNFQIILRIEGVNQLLKSFQNKLTSFGFKLILPKSFTFGARAGCFSFMYVEQDNFKNL